MFQAPRVKPGCLVSATLNLPLLDLEVLGVMEGTVGRSWADFPPTGWLGGDSRGLVRSADADVTNWREVCSFGLNIISKYALPL